MTSPISGENQGVIMRVDDIVQDGRRLQLSVNLQNNSAEEVEFLYSFLEVRDQDNNLLSSFADSLPPSLPGDRQVYNGTIELFGPLPDSVRSVSIRLASYPDEKVKLQIDAIPIP